MATVSKEGSTLPDTFPPGTKFGLVDGAPWSFEEGTTFATRDWSTGAPEFASAGRFLEEADRVTEDEFIETGRNRGQSRLLEKQVRVHAESTAARG